MLGLGNNCTIVMEFENSRDNLSSFKFTCTKIVIKHCCCSFDRVYHQVGKGIFMLRLGWIKHVLAILKSKIFIQINFSRISNSQTGPEIFLKNLFTVPIYYDKGPIY